MSAVPDTTYTLSHVVIATIQVSMQVAEPSRAGGVGVGRL